MYLLLPIDVNIEAALDWHNYKFIQRHSISFMGEAEIHTSQQNCTIYSNIIIYGNSATNELAKTISEEIETMWNEPNGKVRLDDKDYTLLFCITAELRHEITELEVLQNTDPRNNYFRIENYAQTNISFVDAIGCNTGYFLLENLYVGSTTAAHEYGHTLGLAHPPVLDIRGKGVPGIMYPRGTLVDPEFQYDPTKPAGITGGTMHPMYRKVLPTDIQSLQLHKLRFKNNKAIVGYFTNIYHWNHAAVTGENP